MPPDGEPKRRPLIPDAERDDWCTPEPVTPFIYDTLGTVDLDPASNPQSIVVVRRAIWWEQLRNPAVALPRGVEWGDGLQALRTIAPGTTVFLNPPFGRKALPQWVDACVTAFLRGAEIIALWPSYTSSYWFDHIYLTASKVCFWGLPGETTSRLRFGEAQNGAGFAVLFSYWGPRPDRFVRVWSRAGQIWHLDQDRVLTAQLCGHRLRQMPSPDLPSGDLFSYAERRLLTHRYSAISQSCTDILDSTLGDLLDSGAQALKQQFRSLTIGEIVSGLNLSAHAGVDDRPARRAKTGTRGRSRPNGESEDKTSPQLPLRAPPRPSRKKTAKAKPSRKTAKAATRKLSKKERSKNGATRTRAEIAQFDDSVHQALQSFQATGASFSELSEHLKVDSRSKLRDALKRLRSAERIQLQGSRKTARYFVAP